MWSGEPCIRSEAAFGGLKRRVDSMSLLQIAASLQLGDIVRHLLEHTSDAESGPLKQDMEGQTALHAALHHARSPVPGDYDHRWEIFQLIFEKAVLVDFDVVEESLDCIPSATDGNHSSSVKELVENSRRRILSGVEDRDRGEFFHFYLNEVFKSHTLSRAVDKENKAALLAMLASDLPPYTDVSTVLQDAVKLGSQEFVKVLLIFGADPYIITASRRSSLSEAIANNDLNMLELLLQKSYYPPPHHRHGADTTSVMAWEVTLLLEAIKPLPGPDCAMVKALLDQGFPPNVLLNGRSPLIQAIKVDRDDIVKLLLEREADPNPDPTCTVGQPLSFESLYCENLLRFLFIHGADPNAKFKGRTLLHEACSLARLDMVKTLLMCGTKINGIDELGRTALFDAVKSGDPEIVKQLVAGINLQAQDQSNGRYALHEAAIAGNARMVFWIAGRDLSPVDWEGKGKTPLEYARELGHLNVVSVLEDLGVKELVSRGH
jgi:ankyrin repeat protein